MKLIFVHGWSVTDTDTYGKLPEAIQKVAPSEWQLEVSHIYLGEYISFHDEVTVFDIARAFDAARKEAIGDYTEFSCITHSTGAPVLREWINLFYGADSLNSLDNLPLKHLIMLAPANHGSALAQLGKARASRIKSWFDGVEPGQNILNWLELGSSEQWSLNTDWLNYEFGNNLYPVVITGQTIDKKLYDYINSYTAEKGSDGVVRVAATNLNYRLVQLNQNNSLSDQLDIVGAVRTSTKEIAMEVLANTSHSGRDKGIMQSVTSRNQDKKQVVKSIIDSLSVNNEQAYKSLAQDMKKRTATIQKISTKYSMIVFKVIDNYGAEIEDFDIYLLAGNDYRPDKLPKGFHVDTQKNLINKCELTYYLNHNKMKTILDGKIGFRVIARPSAGFSFYKPAEFHSNEVEFDELLKENETVMIEIVLNRMVDKNTFKLTSVNNKRESFKNQKIAGNTI